MSATGDWVTCVGSLSGWSQSFLTLSLSVLFCVCIDKDHHRQSAILDISETACFNVTFRASVIQRLQGQLRLTVVDNQYEDLIIQLVAEGYTDDIVIDCGSTGADDHVEDRIELADDDVPGERTLSFHFRAFCVKSKLLKFVQNIKANLDPHDSV